ncbi:MAG: xanthine dehydrogenase [Clostridia bacterium]|nr:xanthine dehydrogenase [Clostridia bacterium]
MSITYEELRKMNIKEQKLVICGGGHVSSALLRASSHMGFERYVIEDRPSFAAKVKADGAETVICEAFEQALNQIESDEDTYFVIVTRGHRYDLDCLKKILKKPYAYVGMMGSRVRVKEAKQVLWQEGFDPALLEGLHAPIGLAIGAEMPEEIAISILAQLIQVRAEKMKERGQSKIIEGMTKELLEAALQNDERRKMMATIVSRRGSAPRKAGAKMLIYEDGMTVGTIGGGCMEAKVIHEAVLAMHQNEMERQVVIEMLPEEAENEGMVCGGVIEVNIERLVESNV